MTTRRKLCGVMTIRGNRKKENILFLLSLVHCADSLYTQLWVGDDPF